MNVIDNILNDELLKAKGKVTAVGQLIAAGKVTSRELIEASHKATDVNKANIVEGIQWAAEKNASFADKDLFLFLSKSLEDPQNRVKWEAARALEHIIPLFPSMSNKALNALLINTEHKGTVVRWSAARALAAIYAHNAKSRKDLLPVFEAILKRETDNAVKKIYQKAMKAV